MLSFKKGRPVARVVGGKYDGKIIRIYDKSNNKPPANVTDIKKRCCDTCSIECKEAEDKCCNDCCADKPSDIIHNKYINEYLIKFKKNNVSLTNKQLDKLYEGLKEGLKFIEEKENDLTEITIDDGELIPLFTDDPEQNDRFVIYGVSGSGKSTLTGKIIEQNKKSKKKDKEKGNKDYDLILFSKVEQDKALDPHKPIRINLTEELIKDPINNKELENSIVVFDDVETEKNIKLRNTLLMLRDDLAEVGRHQQTNMISTMHHLNFTKKETRTILNEATGLAYFPRSGSLRPITNYFKNIIGLDIKEIKKINKLPSRWIFINRHYPQCIIYDKGIMSLHALVCNN